MSEAEEAPEGVDPTTPTTARLYDYYLGGTANFAADRAMAQRMYEFVPEVSEGAWASPLIRRSTSSNSQNGWSDNDRPVSAAWRKASRSNAANGGCVETQLISKMSSPSATASAPRAGRMSWGGLPSPPSWRM